VRRSVEAANRRDLDAALSIYAPNAVFDFSHRGLPSFEGLAAMRGFLEDWLAAYEEYEFVLEEIVDLGNGVVFAVVHQNARLAGGAGHVRQQEGWVWVWAEGEATRLTTYGDIDEARAAAERVAKSRE
jgi:ketosteroid isomerase-like protein